MDSRPLRVPCVLLALLTAAATVQPAYAQARGAVAFVNVNVVPLDRDVVLQNHTVLVQNGRITAIAASDAVTLARNVTRIDATGQFLLPGLIDLYGHIPDPRDVDEEEDRLLIYLARGVTAVRGVQTHEKQEALRRRTHNDDVRGPRLFFEGRDSLARTGPFVVLRELHGIGEAVSDDAFATTYERLRRVTVEAARTLGIDAEVGTIEVGKRADLLLLGANPLENVQHVSNVVGVMRYGRWWPRTELTRRLEERTRDLIYSYYAAVPRGFGAPSSCRGLTLYDCFGGDAECGAEGRCNVRYIRADRAQLLDRLDLFAEGAPGSELIAGQRVNFALKDANFERAIATAEACAATAWWCQALRGYALNAQHPGDGRLQLDSAFVNAPSGQLAWATPRYTGAGDRGLGCEWSDLSTLVEPALLEEYLRLPCGVNRPFEAKFWFLSDPLWSQPGNERRGEQFARNVAMRLHDEILRARSRLGHHPQSHHMTVMPMGLPNSYRTQYSYDARTRRSSSGIVPYVYGGYSFAPDTLRFRHPMKSTSADWELKWDDGEERMVTREEWYNLEQQTAVLRRGARLLVLAAAPMPLLLTSFEGVQAFLAMGRPSDRRIETVPARIEPNGIMRASTELDAHEWLASIEVVADTFRARARHGAPAPLLMNGFGVSDLVLVHERFERDRMPLLDAMLPSTSLGSRDQVGLYFELYGAQADEPLRITLTGQPINRSILRALAGAVGLGGGAPLNVAWLEPAGTPTDNRLRRFLGVDLTGLNSGDYELVLNVLRADGSAATARRQIHVERQR